MFYIEISPIVPSFVIVNNIEVVNLSAAEFDQVSISDKDTKDYFER